MVCKIAKDEYFPPFPAQFALSIWFAGYIPPELGNLSALTHLDLGGNQLSGESLVVRKVRILIIFQQTSPASAEASRSFWGSFGPLSHIRRFSRCAALFAGPIPETLGGMGELNALILGDNKLTGEI